MKQTTVHTPSGHYAVVCGRGLLPRVGALVSALEGNARVFVLSSPRVWRRWGARLEAGFSEFGGSRRILFDDRESAKTLRTVERVCRQLVRAGADRNAILIALGGGVVGDMVGFVAATYLRGVRVVQVPTTLVAQVDSAIGGKTGVNLPEGKNLIGAFYQPRLVVVDTDVLRTLPGREFRSGLYEVIKYGVIGDEELFHFLEKRRAAVWRRRAWVLDRVVSRCVNAKAEVVSQDERERGLRQILNFGHTVGHALEALTGYKKMLHGEAVGWGMLAAARLAVRLNLLGAEEGARIERLVRSVGPLPRLPALPARRLLEVMHADKKTRGGELHFVLPRRIGRVEVVRDVPEELVADVVAGLGRGAARRKRK